MSPTRKGRLQTRLGRKPKSRNRPGHGQRANVDELFASRDVMTREAFENAMAIIMAVGGSTNAVMHLIAMARAVDVPLTIDDFQRTSDRVPYLADLRPSGKYVQEDLHQVGGTPAVMKLLLDEKLITGDCLTITGKTIAENLADFRSVGVGRARNERKIRQVARQPNAAADDNVRLRTRPA